jgi:hypothetical protein
MTVNPQNTNNSGASGYNPNSGCSTITGPGMGGGGPSNCGSSGSVNTTAGPQFPSPANANYARGNRENVWQQGRPTRTPPTCCANGGFSPGDAVNALANAAAPADNGCSPELRQQLNEFVARVRAADRWAARRIDAIASRCDPPQAANNDNTGLREALRRALSQGRPTGEDPPPDAAPDDAAPDAPPAQQEASTPPPAPPSDDNDGYCSYLASQVVRGELTPGAGTPIPAGCNAAIAAAQAQRNNEPPPFSMSPVETRQEMDRLEQETQQQPGQQQPAEQQLGPPP